MQILVTSMVMGKIYIENNIQLAKTEKGRGAATERRLLAKSTGTRDPLRKETGRSSGCEQVKESARSPHHLEAQGQEIQNESRSAFTVNYKQMEGRWSSWGSLIKVRPKASI